MSIYEPSRVVNNDYSEIDNTGYTLKNPNQIDQNTMHDPSVIHFKILELIQENSKLIQLLTDFD